MQWDFAVERLENALPAKNVELTCLLGSAVSPIGIGSDELVSSERQFKLSKNVLNDCGAGYSAEFA